MTHVDDIEANADALVALFAANPGLRLEHSRQVDLAGYVEVDGVVYVGTRLAARLQGRAMVAWLVEAHPEGA